MSTPSSHRTTPRMLLACACFSAWFSALLFGVLGPAAHLFLLAALVLWPWRATFAVARGDDPATGVPTRPD